MDSPHPSQHYSTNPTTQGVNFSSPESQGNMSPAQPSNVPPYTQNLSGLNSSSHRSMASRVRRHCPRMPLLRADFARQWGATVSAQDAGCNNSVPVVIDSGHDQAEHPSTNLVDPNNSARKRRGNIDQPPDAQQLGHIYNTGVEAENATFAPHAFINQGGDSMAEAFLHNGMRRSYPQSEDGRQRSETNWQSMTSSGTIRSILYPKQYSNPTPTMSNTKPSSSGVSNPHFEDAQHTQETNWNSQIHSDGELGRLLSFTRQLMPSNTIQSILCPTQCVQPATTIGNTKPPTSGLHQLKTNHHSHIYSNTEWARSMSVPLAGKQTVFNDLPPVPSPKQCLVPTPTMSITKPSSSGLYPNNVFNFGGTVMGNSSMQQGRKSNPLFEAVAESLFRESTDGSNLLSLLSSCLMQSSNKSVVLIPIKDQSTQAEKSTCNAENAGDEEFYRWNPRKGRETRKSSNGESHIISCQCKKINCTKLYCECFTAGSYCTENCLCQGCLNVEECSDEVRKAREQIVSRNPLAFAPKVIPHSIGPFANGSGKDGICLRASSAKHIKGCSCKKSMCLKKYCDCYQSKVGCSDGCRCEGCQNVYGRKGGKGLLKGPLSGEKNNERTDDSFNTTNDQNSNPLSQTFLPSNQEDEESILLWCYKNELMLPIPLDNDDSVSETGKDQKPKGAGTSPGVLGDWTNCSAPGFPSGTAIPHSCAGSQNWRGSRISPVHDYQGTETDQMFVYAHESHDSFKDNQPETLDDPPMSLNTVKVSSQNMKQVSVSPPHSPVHASPAQQMKD